MKYLKEEFSHTYEEKKSKFIAHIMPYSRFDEVMKRLKEEHPKGRHFVYAYRYLNEFDQIVENCSDDGEPKGTSGKPSLNVLAGNELINSGVIIVRYFGGIKLGTGGLVRAYSDAVNYVIEEASLYKYEKLFSKELECSYTELSKVEYLLEDSKITINEKIFSENIILQLQAPQENFDSLMVKLPRNIKIVQKL